MYFNKKPTANYNALRRQSETVHTVAAALAFTTPWGPTQGGVPAAASVASPVTVAGAAWRFGTSPKPKIGTGFPASQLLHKLQSQHAPAGTELQAEADMRHLLGEPQPASGLMLEHLTQIYGEPLQMAPTAAKHEVNGPAPVLGEPVPAAQARTPQQPWRPHGLVLVWKGNLPMLWIPCPRWFKKKSPPEYVTQAAASPLPA